MKIYENTPGGLYPQPGRTVTTFPSGLIRVDQSYVCADATADMVEVPDQITLTGSCLLNNSETIPLPKTLDFNGYINGKASYHLILGSWRYEVFYNAGWKVSISLSGVEDDYLYSSSYPSASAIPSFTTSEIASGSGNCTASAASGSTLISPTSALAIGNPMPDGNSKPAIDGLYIFPTPQEDKRGDGFTEFMVSAYGRVSSTLSGIQLTPTTVSFNGALTYKLYNIVGSIVILSGTVLEYDDLNLTASLIDPFDFSAVDANSVVLDATIINEGTKGEITDTGNVIPRSFKLWQVRLTSDGITPSTIYQVQVFPPSVSIKSYRHFGHFVEVDVETTIENSTTEITA